jgi:hypothetical protein
MEHFSHALKEWAIAVNALERGETILLLRKGGIREQGGKFSVERDRVLLYPTYEHQKLHLLKSPYDEDVHPVASEATVVDALYPYHVWNAQFVEERLKWKPKSPLYVLTLRVFKLSEPRLIPYQSEYGGCRSWIDLQASIALEGATPVLTDIAYSEQIHQIRELVTTH